LAEIAIKYRTRIVLIISSYLLNLSNLIWEHFILLSGVPKGVFYLTKNRSIVIFGQVRCPKFISKVIGAECLLKKSKSSILNFNLARNASWAADQQLKNISF